MAHGGNGREGEREGRKGRRNRDVAFYCGLLSLAPSSWRGYLLFQQCSAQVLFDLGRASTLDIGRLGQLRTLQYGHGIEEGAPDPFLVEG